ncbi:MAG: HXXEE domain-containing protein [Halioglobus sp.]|nr:HXXEE domain-containing protein [Halioglobus sp.]
MASLAPSALLLGVLAAVALAFATRRTWRTADPDLFSQATRWTLLLIILQCLHFSEELATGFHIRFPALFGQPAMPLAVFVLFNLVLIVIWLACLSGIAGRKRRVLFPLAFLCLAALANMVAHPVFALLGGGYFPGLWTSPVLGIAAIITSRTLLNLTEPT